MCSFAVYLSAWTRSGGGAGGFGTPNMTQTLVLSRRCPSLAGIPNDFDVRPPALTAVSAVDAPFGGSDHYR